MLSDFIQTRDAGLVMLPQVFCVHIPFPPCFLLSTLPSIRQPFLLLSTLSSRGPPFPLHPRLQADQSLHRHKARSCHAGSAYRVQGADPYANSRFQEVLRTAFPSLVPKGNSASPITQLGPGGVAFVDNLATHSSTR